MRTISTTVYTYDELNEEAKERARDWYREADSGDTFFAEYPTDEFHDLLEACGFDVDKKRGLRWSGFSYQGDGAAFAGSWQAERCKPQALLADRPVSYVDESGTVQRCQTNERWHKAVAPIVALAARYPTAYGSVRMSGRGNNVLADSFDAEDDDIADSDALAEELADAARDLADAFYRALEAEYTYQNSDESIEEMIKANEYEFTEEGARA